MTSNNGKTIEERILELLSDGRRHEKEEIRKITTTISYSSTYAHISNLRRKLRPVGEDIICESDKGKSYYRRVRNIGSGE